MSAADGRASTGTYERLRQRALRELEAAQLDPSADVAAVRALIGEVVTDYQRRAHLGSDAPLRDSGEMVERLVTSITAFGPLTELLDRDDVEEIFIEGDRVRYLDGTGRLQGLQAPTSVEENLRVVERLLADSQRRLDAATPLVQARVLDGRARLTAAIAPVAEGLSATLRRHTMRRDTLRTLTEQDALSEPAAAFLWAAMQGTTSLLVSGPPGAGKTSLLAALLAAAPVSRCVRCCEEIRELQVPLAHGSFYETRPAGLDGRTEIDLRALVKFVLAMRPDHIVVGEVRGAEAFELTRAVNAGCGFACTIHANSARNALDALVNAAVLAGERVEEPALRAVFASALDIVVHLELGERADGRLLRQVSEILAVVPSLHHDFSTEPLFVRERLGAPLEWTGALPACAEAIERRLPESLTLRGLLEQGASW